MDINEVESLNRIPLTVRVRKLKWPIVMRLNEFEKDEDMEFDVFESNSTGVIRMVELPEDLAELHACLQDMLQVVEITSLKYDIGFEALRLAVHLFYRIVLREKLYDYHSFVLYYEQYNKPWTLFSEDYFRTLKFSKRIENLDLQEVKLSNEKSKIYKASTSLDDTSILNGFHDDLVSSLSNLNLGYKELGGRVDLTLGQKTFKDHLPFKSLRFLENQRCVYIHEAEGFKECTHSKLVLYHLFNSGDFLIVTFHKDGEYRECPCYMMKCEMIRDIHPLYSELAWGKRSLCGFKYWCYINCLIKSRSFQMLKIVQPWVEGVKPGILAPFTPNDFKRLSLKTAALKALIYNYFNIN